MSHTTRLGMIKRQDTVEGYTYTYYEPTEASRELALKLAIRNKLATDSLHEQRSKLTEEITACRGRIEGRVARRYKNGGIADGRDLDAVSPRERARVNALRAAVSEIDSLIQQMVNRRRLIYTTFEAELSGENREAMDEAIWAASEF